jgi:hypothetical protein
LAFGRLDWQRQLRVHGFLPLAPQPFRLVMVVTITSGEIRVPKSVDRS